MLKHKGIYTYEFQKGFIITGDALAEKFTLVQLL